MRYYDNPEYKEKLRKARAERKKRLGYVNSVEAREKIRLSRLGKPSNNKGKTFKHTEEAKQKISYSLRITNSNHRQKVAPNNFDLIRSTAEYAEWRKAVFKRDNYTCQFCGKRGVRLNADHIKPFALFDNLRLNVNNGRTLCEPCHQKTYTYGRTMFNIKTILGLLNRKIITSREARKILFGK
jgi:predicted restriction endonuclease